MVTGTHGAFTLTRDDPGGTLSWSYTLNTRANALADGQTAHSTERATDDDSNPSVPEVITITITGANDVPVITSADTTPDTYQGDRRSTHCPQTGTFIATDADIGRYRCYLHRDRPRFGAAGR